MFALLLTAVTASGEPAGGGSYLSRPSFCLDHVLRGPSSTYQPEPGDIMLATDGSAFWLAMHNLAGTSHPTHSGIVYRRPDGSLAILEAGPHDTLRCRTLPAVPHLKSYECVGRVWIRRRTIPLIEEESCRLTRFCEETDWKRFAIGRLGLQLTPLRPRGPLRTAFVGKPHYDRNSYYCSELVMEALVNAGLVDPRTARPSATYPEDLFFDRSRNRYLNRHLKLAPCWDPPARWTSRPIGSDLAGSPVPD